jgi:LmbE family N-acetylglucosaminyl deacetylase
MRDNGRPDALPRVGRLLAVVAHPDDESFGLGGLIGAFVAAGTRVDVLCLTRGEASTLGSGGGRDLAAERAQELEAAGEVLGVEDTCLLDWPDGELAEHRVVELGVPIAATAGDVGAQALLVFDDTGVTGHADHRRATEAALAVAEARRLPVHAWALPRQVADRLNAEFGTSFAGHPPTALDLEVAVDRQRQRRAVRCHASQATDNAVLWRRLELAGDTDHLRRLR